MSMSTMTEEAIMADIAEETALSDVTTQVIDSSLQEQQLSEQHETLAPHESEIRTMTRDVMAYIDGKPIFDLPDDLFIPPEALQVFLEAFEGPLDLLLYLIKKQNMDILDIPILKITHQYIAYIDMMNGMKLELAAEYLLMAAMLAEIKSRMLLPRDPTAEGEEELDPRAELVRRLQEYEQFKKAAEDLDYIPRYDRDIHAATVMPPELSSERPLPEVCLKELLLAFADVMKRVQMNASHQVTREMLSIRERMTAILDKLQGHNFAEFTSLFTYSEGRMGVVVTFIAILELVKQSMVDIVQAEPFSPIHIKIVGT